jgi:hypothetical protein
MWIISPYLPPAIINLLCKKQNKEAIFPNSFSVIGEAVKIG